MPLPAPAVAALPWIAAVIDAQAEGVTAPDELKRVAIEAGATEEEWEMEPSQDTVLAALNSDPPRRWQ